MRLSSSNGAVDFSQALFQFGTHTAVLCYTSRGGTSWGGTSGCDTYGRGARV